MRGYRDFFAREWNEWEERGGATHETETTKQTSGGHDEQRKSSS